MEPGVPDIIQLPAGRPFSTTEPVDEKQVVCVMEPVIGTVGILIIFKV
jgi:hypothetical protein